MGNFHGLSATSSPQLLDIPTALSLQKWVLQPTNPSSCLPPSTAVAKERKDSDLEQSETENGQERASAATQV